MKLLVTWKCNQPIRRLLGVVCSVTALVMLSACHPRVEVDFTSDPRILRGSWEGMLWDDPEHSGEGVLLHFELQAEYRDRNSYDFSGQMWLADEGPFEMEGAGHGGQTEIYTQSTWVPPPSIAGFTAVIPTLNLRICANGGRAITDYYGWMFNADTPPASPSVCSGCRSHYCLYTSPPSNFRMSRVEIN